MRLLPSCSEGFRRLALVLGIVTFLAVLAISINGYLSDVAAQKDYCANSYMDRSTGCEHGTEAKECEARAFTAEMACYKASNPPPSERSKIWGFYAIGALLCAYFAALIVRTLGWIVAGFGKGEAKA